MSRTWKLAAICACLVAVVIVSPSGVLAHETREVDGYQLVVGWVVEPVFLGEKNGLDLQVRLPAEEGSAPTPVEGLQNTLQAQVLFGGQTRDLELRPVFRQPGRYAADVAPTREGDYRFRVFGTIEGLEVDETFDSADGGFDGVRSIRDIQFPENLPPLADISRTADAAVQQASAAEQAASDSQTLSLAAVVLGGMGVLLGAVALLAGKRRRPS